MSKIVRRFSLLILLSICVVSCANRGGITPHEILGIYIGMSQTDAEKQLNEIAIFTREDRKSQKLWTLKSNKNFSHLAVGYDSNKNVRYVTAFASEQTTAEKIRYDQFGDLNKARKNPLMGNQEYVWEMPAVNNRDKYLLIVRGTDLTFAETLILKRGDLADHEKEQ